MDGVRRQRAGRMNSHERFGRLLRHSATDRHAEEGQVSAIETARRRSSGEKGAEASQKDEGRRRSLVTGFEQTAETSTALLAVLPELKLLIGLVSTAVIIAALYFGKDILMPLGLAFLIGFVLDPLVSRLRRLGLPRTWAVIAVVLAALSIVTLAGALLGAQVSAISAELPVYQSNTQHKLEQLREKAGRPGMFDGAIRMFKTVKAEVDKAPVETTSAADRTAAAALPPLRRVQVIEKEPAPFDQALSVVESAFRPLATAGIVLVFVVLVLLDRIDLRDRLLRLWSGSLHRSTDAMDEAGARISKYLTMQLVVNFSYGVPMAVGLWLIGVPGAILWGAIAAVLRFVPYLGPMISAVFPLVLAFAVDPGWSMVLWTIALIISLEVLSNNLVEPWLYGASTGLSAMSLMVAATFWTLIWGPIGLIMSTPLTVCLLVVGRHLPRLKFLDVLLGSQPALDTPTRIYQRLLAGDVEEAIQLATEQAERDGVATFYNDIGIPVLRMATSDHAIVATAEHRHRVVMGMDALIEYLYELHPPPEHSGSFSVVCVGGKWEVDNLAAKMLAHALSVSGQPADFRLAAPVNAEFLAGLDLRDVATVFVSYFSPEPESAARHFCQRFRRRWPEVQIALALWNAPPEALGEEARKRFSSDAVVTSLSEAVLHSAHLLGQLPDDGYSVAPIPSSDGERAAALRASGALDPRAVPIFDAASRRAADIFDVQLAMVSLISEELQDVRGSFGNLPGMNQAAPVVVGAHPLNMPRSLSMCGHVIASANTLVVPDVARDIRFANNPALKGKLRFYAGAPLKDGGGHTLGTLCLLSSEPKALTERDVKLLEALARDVMEALRDATLHWDNGPSLTAASDAPPSAIVAQVIPSGV